MTQIFIDWDKCFFHLDIFWLTKEARLRYTQAKLSCIVSCQNKLYTNVKTHDKNIHIVIDESKNQQIIVHPGGGGKTV